MRTPIYRPTHGVVTFHGTPATAPNELTPAQTELVAWLAVNEPDVYKNLLAYLKNGGTFNPSGFGAIQRRRHTLPRSRGVGWFGDDASSTSAEPGASAEPSAGGSSGTFATDASSLVNTFLTTVAPAYLQYKTSSDVVAAQASLAAQGKNPMAIGTPPTGTTTRGVVAQLANVGVTGKTGMSTPVLIGIAAVAAVGLGLLFRRRRV